MASLGEIRRTPDHAHEAWRQTLKAASSATPLLDDQAPGRALGPGDEFRRLERPLDGDVLGRIHALLEQTLLGWPALLAGAWTLVQNRHTREGTLLFGELLAQEREFLLPTLVEMASRDSAKAWLEGLARRRDERTGWGPLTPETLRELLRSSPGAAPFASVISVGEVCRTPVIAPVLIRGDLQRSRLTVDYLPAHWTEHTAERALRHLRNALLALTTDPGAPLASLSLADDEDRAVYARLNATQVDYPLDTCLHRLIESQIERTPDAVAVVAEAGQLTYRELNHRANQLARYLREHGAGRDIPIGICVERSLEMVVGLLAILKSGSAYVPLDPSYPRERLELMIGDAEAPIVLVQRRTESLLPASSARTVRIDEPLPSQGGVSTNLELEVHPGDLAYVIFTSGSTGKPKGAMNEHRAIVNRLLWMQDMYRLTPEDRVLQKTPFSFDVSVWEFFWPLLTGARLVMARPDGHKDSNYLVDVIGQHGITTLHFVPSMLQAFLLDPRAPGCSSVRRVICSGEALPLALAQQFAQKLGAELHNLYGPTEAAVDVTYWHCEKETSRVSVPIGRPVANTQIHILDEALNPCPIGVPGELHIGGVQVGRGYLRRPELTAEKFIPDPFGPPGARLYKTGDLACVTPEAIIEYLGRIDFQVKLRGFRIELGEIEARLTEHAGVAQAAVLLRGDRPGDPRLVAYLVQKGDQRVDAAHLKNWLGTTLPEFMVPSAFVWLDTLPLNPSGKLDRKALPAPTRQRPLGTETATPPRTERERSICALFADLLDLDTVGATDSFFELGGSSLLSMRAVARLSGELGLEVPVARFFQHPTPRALDEYLGGQSLPSRSSRRLPAAALGIRAEADSVAVVGMAGRFPGARDIRELWDVVSRGLSTVTFFDDQGLDTEVPRELREDPGYVRARGIIEDYDKFDAPFFSISPREAELLDPQQRLLLQTAWEALEHAGYVPETVPGLVGVYAGQYSNTYLTNNLLSHPELEALLGLFGLLVVNEKDYAATRIAHKLDLLGPAVSIHTACSTSLVAVVEAFFSLRAGRCDMALAGAASVTCPVRSGYVYAKGGMLSEDGHTRSFDAAATGTTFNDGVAMVVLKRLSDALRDRDTIYGVIRGAASNNDGGAKASFTAPSVEGQAAVIAMAQSMAGVHPRQISYIETHGTATPLGDPIEVEALTEVFRASTQDCGFCTLGSVKSNLGHLVAAAGATGLIKTLLALGHRVLPPTAHFRTPNPNIDFAKTPFVVSSELRDWPSEGHPRLAGVSAFGVGGTNAHLVVEEAPEVASVPSGRPCQLLVWSARTPLGLQRATENLAQHCCDHPDLELADAAYTLALGRRAFSERRTAVATTATEFAHRLADPQRLVTHHCDGNAPPIAFLFPGQGAQYAGMGHGLYTVDPVFRTVVDECAERLLPELGQDLRALLFPADDAAEAAGETLRNTSFTQPALFTIEYAMAELLRGWGIVPGSMVGHSVGEFVCAVLAGVMTLADALRLVASRGRMIQSLPRGAMLSVRKAATEVLGLLSDGLSIASDNGPSLCVVSGPVEKVAELAQRLSQAGVPCRELVTSHAFHSPMMDPVVEPFAELMRSVPLSVPKIPYVSTVTGKWVRDEDASDPRYWAGHLRQTVRFSEAVRELMKQERLVLVEVGPRSTLSTLARQHASRPADVIAVPTLGSPAVPSAEWNSVLQAVGQVWVAGGAVDWASFYADETRKRVALPCYPFERQRCWVDRASGTAAAREVTGCETAALSAAASQLGAGPAPRPEGAPLGVSGLIERQLEVMRRQIELVGELRQRRNGGRDGS